MLSALNTAVHISPTERADRSSVISQSRNPVIDRTRQMIEKMPKLPGIAADAKPEDIQKHRENLLACLDKVDKTGDWCYQQDDASIRPIAVGLQAIFEQALLTSLASGEVAKADVVFITANPVTPLCHAAALSTPSLLSRSVANHAGSYDTVISRINTVPALLNHPDVNVCALYAHKRENASDQAIYDDVCRSHPDSNKFLSLCTELPLPDNFSGANYFVVSKDNTVNMFCLRITQANKETDNCSIFTHDGQNRLADLYENYLHILEGKYSNDTSLAKFIGLFRQNYS
ncbi:type I-F CRISPR-associated protein Csy2 [Lelliottia sp. WAP21]|uniref:type I-F CRISPR-associated protein Csy2 n=1 Tax=Lelliottia sp. WAP21 TaxID=2877426 RepID=UPI001E597A02|nr:type I-F CRISPR-associated protein Csy2 [Lelliottia sp. WAP21]